MIRSLEGVVRFVFSRFHRRYYVHLMVVLEALMHNPIAYRSSPADKRGCCMNDAVVRQSREWDGGRKRLSFDRSPSRCSPRWQLAIMTGRQLLACRCWWAAAVMFFLAQQKLPKPLLYLIVGKTQLSSSKSIRQQHTTHTSRRVLLLLSLHHCILSYIFTAATSTRYI